MKKKTIKNLEWRRRNRAKHLAHKAVERAMECGRLIRDVCVRCGDPKTVAHHENYSRQLEVIWLCAACHKARHRDLANGAGPITSGFAPIRPLPPRDRPRIVNTPQQLAAGIYICTICGNRCIPNPKDLSGRRYRCTSHAIAA